MKQIPAEQLPADVRELIAAAQRERVMITRDGEPYALIVGIEFKDDEDLELEASRSFWKMIEDRRKQTSSMSMDEVKAHLEAEEKRERKQSSATGLKERTRRQGQRKKPTKR